MERVTPPTGSRGDGAPSTGVAGPRSPVVPEARPLPRALQEPGLKTIALRLLVSRAQLQAQEQNHETQGRFSFKH